MHVSSMMRDAAGNDEDGDMGSPFAAAAAHRGAGGTLADPFSLMPFASAQGQTPTELAADSSTFPVEPPPPALEPGAHPLQLFPSHYSIDWQSANQNSPKFEPGKTLEHNPQLCKLC